MRQKLNRLPEPSARARLHRDDWRGASVYSCWFSCRHLPGGDSLHLLISEARLALRISNVDCRNDAVSGRLRVWALLWGPSLADGPCDGCHRCRVCRNHDRARRMTSMRPAQGARRRCSAVRLGLGPGSAQQASQRSRRHRTHGRTRSPSMAYVIPQWSVLCGSGFHGGPRLASP